MDDSYDLLAYPLTDGVSLRLHAPSCATTRHSRRVFCDHLSVGRHRPHLHRLSSHLPLRPAANAASLASLALTIGAALGVIFAFSYYISVARGLSLRARFLEMAGLSLGVALVSFGIGYRRRHFTGVDA